MNRPAIRRAALATAGAFAVFAAEAGPRLPFYGDWACVQMIEGRPAGPLGAANERYGPEGVTLLSVADSKPTPLRVRPVSRTKYDLRYPDRARARIEMKSSNLFIRTTAEHAYLCARPAH